MQVQRTFYYHRRERNAVKKGALLFDDGTYFEFDLSNEESFIAAEKKVKEAVGFVWETKEDFYAEGIDGWVTKKNTLQDAADSYFKIAKEKKEHEEFLANNPDADLEEQLKCHDWYYQYSDDHRVWCGGEAHWRKIKGLIEKVPVDKVKELWAKYAPKDYNCPV